MSNLQLQFTFTVKGCLQNYALVRQLMWRRSGWRARHMRSSAVWSLMRFKLTFHTHVVAVFLQTLKRLLLPKHTPNVLTAGTALIKYSSVFLNINIKCYMLRGCYEWQTKEKDGWKRIYENHIWQPVKTSPLESLMYSMWVQTAGHAWTSPM